MADFYGVMFTKDRERKIFTDWKTCDAAMRGRPHLMKGFDTEEEANKWLDGITEAQMQDNVRKSEYWSQRRAKDGSK